MDSETIMDADYSIVVISEVNGTRKAERVYANSLLDLNAAMWSIVSTSFTDLVTSGSDMQPAAFSSAMERHLSLLDNLETISDASESSSNGGSFSLLTAHISGKPMLQTLLFGRTQQVDAVYSACNNY